MSGVLLSLLQSCELFKYDASICDIDFMSINLNYDGADNLIEEIGFEIYSIKSCPSAVKIQNLQIFKSCYATTKCAEWQNSLDISSFKLYLDKSLYIDNDTIDS